MIDTDRAANEEIRKAQVSEFLSSGMGAKAWCEQNNMSLTCLRYWRRKLAAGGDAGGKWVDIASVANTGTLPTSCTSIVPAAGGSATIRIGAFSIEVARNTDAEALRTALAVAASLC